nr:hypothetical protein BaRGS_031004 [Batillaria attramentaria]
MKELVQVFKILNVCADRVDSQPLYEQPIVDILRLCALPYLKEKSSDELIYEQIVIESLLFRSVDVLWNLLEFGDKQAVSDQLNNITLKSHNPLVKQLKLMTNHEDFELKKLLFNILVLLSRDPTVIAILSEGHLLLALFSFVRANDKQVAPREWTTAQFEELQLQSMVSLCTLCPLMPEDYMTCQGSTRLLLLLEWCVGPDSFGGQGNSFFGTSGRGNKKAQMRQCLRLMRSVVSTEDEMVLQDLADQGAINQLLGVLNTAFIKVADECDTVEIEMQADILFILSCLCDGDMHRKELFGVQGVDMVVRYLKTDTKLINSGLGHHKLLLAAIDCTWCAIVGCYVTEDYFLEKEGVFLLIDLLEVCPKNMHNLIMGCLLDLCENPKTINHVLTWRGQDSSSAAHLFCHIWRKEETEIGCKRDAHGAISDVTKPLMGHIQEERGTVSLPAKCPSQAIVDVSENMRAKIYSIFCKIGFTDLPGLTVEDHVTLVIIEKYLDFKMGEVWTETMKELEVENVRPVTPDAEAMEAISRAIDERAQIVASTQSELLEAQHNQDILDEQEFYAEIRENHRQKEKTLADFADYVARTSNYSLLKAAKERQEISIGASRVQPKYREADNFHDTKLHNLKTTVFSGKQVKVENSLGLSRTDTDLAPYDPGDLPSTDRQLIKHLTI